MNFTHFQIKVDQWEGQFVGSWRAGFSPFLDQHHYAFESNLPLGKTITQGELEEFAFVSISKAAERLEKLHAHLAAQ